MPDEGVGHVLVLVHLADPVVEGQTARSTEVGDDLHVAIELAGPDVLVHPDRDDLVVGAVLDFTVVLDPDFAHIGESGPGDRLPGVLGLELREGYPYGPNPVILGSMDQQRTPAAADVEQALARLKPQLLADYVQFTPLGLLE